MRPSYQIIIMFVLAQLLAFIIGAILIDNSEALGFMSVAPAESSSGMNVVYFIVAIVVTAAALLFVLTLPIRDILIKALEFLSTFVASFVVFFVLLLALGVDYPDLIALILSLALYLARLRLKQMRNVLAIIAAAGIGALIGFSLDPLPIVLLIVVVAIYDMIAVWWTKHMVEFARYFSRTPTTFTIAAQEMTEVRVKRKGRIVKEIKPSMMQLGTGDLSIPATFIVTLYKYGNFFFPAAALVGATIGLYFILRRAEEEKKVFPAMPSIVLGSLFAFFAAVFVYYVLGML